jgi:formylglycine-generating enzyme required for sulfatase activity
MVKEMIRDDTASREGLSRLEQREAETDGWYHAQLRKELQQVMADRVRPAAERARAGDVLARLGDPRFRPEAWYLPEDEFLGFVEIPAGQFLMGEDVPHDRLEADRQGPQHEVVLPTFYMNRYPVTMAQYWAFVRDTSLKNQSVVDEKNLGSRPITSVSRSDALRYCRWLTEKLRKSPGTSGVIARLLGEPGDGPAWVVALPSEAEWEKAARGAADARLFPWGSKPDPNLANYKDTGLGMTCAVGCFPGGQSPYGIQEMSGNVCEWTRSAWGPEVGSPHFQYPYDPLDGRESLWGNDTDYRVIRGGSYYSSFHDIRCCQRGAARQKDGYTHVGFRLAITRLAQA